MRVAEEGFDAERLVQAMVLGELGAVVECDGAAHVAVEALEPIGHPLEDSAGCLALEAGEVGVAGLSFMQHEQGLSVFGEHHQVGLPMAGLASVFDLYRSVVDGSMRGEVTDRAAAAPSGPAALEAGLWQ